MKDIKLYKDDCLEVMKNIPDKFIDLILIDPPYNISKEKWDKWKTIEKYIEFMGKVFLELQRVLKDNGSFYFFHNDFLQMVELQNFINKNTDFVFKQLITWNKTNFRRPAWVNRDIKKCKARNWFPNIEYCLFYTFQDQTGLKKLKTDMSNFKILREYFRDYQIALGMNKKQIIEKIGQRADHCFRWESSQWDLPTEETYKELNKLPLKYKFIRKEYEDLRKVYEDLRKVYEKERYKFNLEEIKNNISCVWEDNLINTKKLHPCEKPIDILEKIIKTSSNEGDVVLDCFLGSGSTGIAAINTNRKFIGIEKDEKYFNIAEERIKRRLIERDNS